MYASLCEGLRAGAGYLELHCTCRLLRFVNDCNKDDSSGRRAYVLPVMYLFLSFFLFRHSFSELPRPIALKLCHMVGIWLNFIIPLQNSGAPPPKKKSGPKTCKISVNFGPLQTLIANISGMAQDIKNRKTLQTMAIPPAYDEKSPVNFGPLAGWNYM